MPTRRDDDIAREIRTHLELEAEARIAAGMSDVDARAAARRAFGNVTRTQEDVRAEWTRRWLDEMVQDVRYALRTLRRSPAFTVVAVLTIALGIGANAAMFSVVNSALLQPLGYPRPEQLRVLSTDGSGSVSPAEYYELAEIDQSFAVVGAFAVGEANLSTQDRPRRVARATVTAELLEALAVPASRGRWFVRDETRGGGPPVAILSHELWQSAYGAREDLVGGSIEIDGVRREVVGIMPAGFDLLDKRVELWLPLQLEPAIRRFRASHFLSVLGRLKEGVTPEQAEAHLASLMATWGQRVGPSEHVFSPGRHVLQMAPVLDTVVGSSRRAFWLLQAGVGLVLLIACANLANLLMVRAEGRGREVAVRRALGASRHRLIAQFVVEGVVLLVLGAALGLAFAWSGLRALTAAYPESLPRVAGIGLDPAVLGFTLFVAALTGVVFGLAPLRYLSERGNRHLLHDRTPVTMASPAWVRRALVAGEVGLAVVLVVGAGLMVRTVVNLMHVDAGFDRSRLVTFAVALPAATYPTSDARVQLYDRLTAGLDAIPGTDGVAMASGLPPQRERNAFGTDIEHYTPPPGAAELVEYYQAVSTGYFETMRLPVVAGRAFASADRAGAPVAIVNEAFVRVFWNGQDAIGRRVRPRFGDQTPWVTVIGVARDVRQGGVDQQAATELYLLHDQLPRIFPTVPPARLATMLGGSMHVVLRSASAASSLQGAIAATVRQADPSLPIIRLRDMEEVFLDAVRRPRMLMQLLTGFAVLALLLAALGTYGVLSYMVTQHRREIGIRMALGAERTTVLRGVLGYGLTLASVGIVGGLAAALALTRLMETLLFGVRPSDPLTLAGVAAVVAAVAAAASVIPALRATRVDPIVALRDE
jgi:predicted permease